VELLVCEQFEFSDVVFPENQEAMVCPVQGMIKAGSREPVDLDLGMVGFAIILVAFRPHGRSVEIVGMSSNDGLGCITFQGINEYSVQEDAFLRDEFLIFGR